MNVFCRLFGHTWIPVTEAPPTRWNTTKDGHILTASASEDEVRHLLECRRCGDRKADSPRRFDRDGLDAAEASAEA